AAARWPELNAGWPQQDWRGTSTVQPASSSSLTAAKPTAGRIRSTRQVTSSPTRFRGGGMRSFRPRVHGGVVNPTLAEGGGRRNGRAGSPHEPPALRPAGDMRGPGYRG